MYRLIPILFLVAACSGSKSSPSTPRDDGAPTNDTPTDDTKPGGIPKAFAEYEPNHEITRWERYEIPGVELWRVTVVGVSDLSRSTVMGVDASGALVSGIDLFAKVGDLDATALAGRALDILYGKAHGAALENMDDNTFFPAEQRALVKPPVLDDGTLELWTVFGEMSPRLTRVRLDVATGKDERTPAEHVLNPPPDPLPPIRKKLASKDPKVVVEGLTEVSEHCDLAPEVAALLEHSDARVRSTALDILGNLGAAAYVPNIIRMMREGPEWGDRSLAGQKLLYFPNHPDAMKALRDHVATASGQEVSVLRDAIAYHEKNPLTLGTRPCER